MTSADTPSASNPPAESGAVNLGDDRVAAEDADIIDSPIPPALSQAVGLPELDHALAADFDQLLQGNFESIDAVLDGVFEEQAVLVQSPGGPTVTVSRPAMAPPAVLTLDDAAMPSAVQPEMSQKVQVDAAPDVEPEAVVMENPAVATPPAAVEAPPPPATQVMSATSQAKTPPRRQRGEPSIVVRMLMWVNIPLRFAPPRLRPVLNWTALTLLAWTPIVWVMVFAMGKNAASHVAASAETPAAAASVPDDNTGATEPATH